MPQTTSQTTFYFDLGSPFAYLTCERIQEILPEPVDWQPISLGALFKLNGRSSWAVGDPQRRQAGMAQIERRARLYGLPPLRWPDPWPGNYLAAMRAAIFAQRAGRGREFTRSAFRAAFQQGLDLSQPEHVLDLARQVDLDPAQMRAALQNPAIKLGLRNATDAAHRSGVFGVPSILAAGELFWGDDRLQEAAIRLARAQESASR